MIDNNNITFENGAVINWTGNVLLYGDNSSISMTINNANVNINGKLIIVPDPSNNKEGNLLMKGSGSGVGGGIEDDSECVLNVGGLPGSDGGSLMAIAAGTSKIEMHLTTGPNMEAPRMHVEGVALYLGSNLDILFDGIDSGGSPHLEYGVTSYAGAKNWGSGAVGDGSEHMTHLKVEGSMVIAGPAGSTLQKLDFGEHLNVRLMFDNDNYEDAVDGIKEISPNISAWVQAGYYELGADVTSGDSAKALLADMLTKIETAAGASQEIGVGQ